MNCIIENIECPKELLEIKAGREYRNLLHVSYHSQVTDTDREANIILPLGYSDNKKYPVLYCLHGFFGNEGTMLVEENNYIPEIVGNMNDAGIAKEVILVYPNMYVNADPNLSPGFSIEANAPYDRIMDELIQSLEPYMLQNYSVLEGKENRGILGFSYGAREAIYIGLMRPDLFGQVCAVAPAPGLIPGKDWAMEHPGMLPAEELKYANPDDELNLFIMCRGSKDSVVGRFPVDYHEVLEQNQVEHYWYEVPGLEHGEPIIQSGIYNLMINWK